MAAPAVEQPVRNEEPPSAGFGERARQFALRAVPSATSVTLGVLMMTLLGSLLIMGTASGGQDVSHRFSITSGAYSLLLSGAFGNTQMLSNTLDKLAPLLLAAFSVAVAFRAGLFNIGAQGQMAIGGTLAIMIGIKFSSAPAWVLGPAVFLAGVVGGAFWASIVGVLKAWRGAHEVVTTIMLNFIAYSLSAYLVDCTGNCIPGVGSIKDPAQPNKTLQMGHGAALPLLSHVINQIAPGTIANELNYRVNVGLLIALAGVFVYWFLMKRTTLGYEIQAVGQSQKAARYAGISVKRNIVVTMVIAGAFAGAAGALVVMGPDLLQALNDQTFRTDSTGFDAISVALLGFTAPLGVLLSGVMFAALIQGSTLMEALSGQLTGVQVRHEIIQFSFEALVLFFIAGQVIPQLRITLVRYLARMMTGFRVGLARLPDGLLALFALADVIALLALVGFVIISVLSLQELVGGQAPIGQALSDADVTTPAILLLIFYGLGLLLALLTIGIRYFGERLKNLGGAPLLVEAFPTVEALSATAAAAATQHTETPAKQDDAAESTL